MKKLFTDNLGAPASRRLAELSPAGRQRSQADRRHRPALTAAAFSLIEMMITVALLGVIIVGLVGMFVETQRAFRGGMAQSDVLEAGRATTDLMTREIEETSAAKLSSTVNFYAINAPAAVQALSVDPAAPRRTNALGEVFFLTQKNLAWTGNGFIVAPVADGVGTLYSYQTAATNNPDGLDKVFSSLAQDVVNKGLAAANASGQLHRVADGIVHLRVLAYSANGYLISQSTSSILVTADPTVAGGYSFTANAVPAYVDLELGVLEHATWEKFLALPPVAQPAYLARAQTAGRVHIFRRHIAIHNVDPTAYQ